MMKKRKAKKTQATQHDNVAAAELYLDYVEHRAGGDICAGQEGHEWPDHDDEHMSFTPRALYRKREAVPDWLCETIELPDGIDPTTTAFIVVVRYATGNTFGRSYGHWAIDGIYADPVAAAELARKITADEQSHGNLSHGYTPWSGYFDRYETVEVHALPVY